MSRSTAVAALALFLLAGGANADRTVETLTIDDSPVVVRVWNERGISHYSVALDGIEFSEPLTTDYTLHLRSGSFDPLHALPGALPVVAEGLAGSDDTHLYLVQFRTQPLQAYREALSELGAVSHWFMPKHAMVVEMSDDVRPQVEALDYVRWVGDYHPSYRIDPALAAALEVGAVPTQRYNIAFFDADDAVKHDVARRIAALGGAVDRVRAGKHLSEATLTPEQLVAVVRFDEVMSVGVWSPYTADMDVVRNISGGNYVETVGGYTGAGVRGEVLDIGFNTSHLDFASRPLVLHGAVSSDSHGASCSGIVFGDGSVSSSKRGMLPDAQGIVADTDTAFTGAARYQHTAELVEDPYFALFQSASVGSLQTSDYTEISMDHDVMLFDFDIVHAQSQSNTGSTLSRPQAWAKNVISVGGVRHHGTLSKADDCWNCGSTAASHGPAADGRIKPDLCHFYDNTGTVTSGSPTAYTESFGGTSGATPIVSGHIGLFFDMWADGVFGNAFDPGATDFENRCHMTTAKAAMINHAVPYDWNAGGPNSDIDRFRQGWGMPDVGAMYDDRDKVFFIDESAVIAPFEQVEFVVAVLPGEAQLVRTTMVYVDPPGNPAASVHRINDLSLRVTSPSGATYWGNNFLQTGLWSNPGGFANQVDTVENVFVQNPEVGNWTIAVLGTEIIADTHRETPELDADFALWVSGVAFPLAMTFESDVPPLVDPLTPVDVQVRIVEGSESIVPGSAQLLYRFESGSAFVSIPLAAEGVDLYGASVPGAPCDAEVEFYFTVSGSGGTDLSVPNNAPASTFGYDIGTINTIISDDFETNNGFSVENIALDDGGWDRGVPAGGGDRGDPANDYDGSGACWLTDNEDGNSDVDGGPTILTSPIYDITASPDPMLSYARWFTVDDNDIDRLDVEVSDDGGATWNVVESVPHTLGWVEVEYRIADFVAITSQFRVRFSATDNPNNSVTEAAIDALFIGSLGCDDGGGLVGDVDGDGDVDFADLVALLAAWGDCPDPPAECPADFDLNGTVDFNDLVALLAAWTG